MRHQFFECIEVNYNHNNRHSITGFISPAALDALKEA